MTTNLALASIKSTGSTTSRTFAARYSDIKNVKDFGAIGEGFTDDTAAIQSAVDYATSPYSANNRGVIFFPQGTYKLTSSVTFSNAASVKRIAFIGVPGAKITGSFADGLLKRAQDTPIGGVYWIEGLELENTHAAGKAIMLHSCVSGTVRNCDIHGTFIGVETFGSQSITVQDCSIIGTGAANSVGIIAGNATSVVSCDVSGYADGIRHCNVGLTVVGGRYEANTRGIVIGVDNTGSMLQSTGYALSGMSMEQNGTAIDIVSGALGGISGVSIGSGIAVAYGIRVRSADDLLISGCGCSSGGGFSTSGISLESATRVKFSACTAASWSIAGSLGSFELDMCDTDITVSLLPTSPIVGTKLVVSDSTVIAIGSAVTTGGNSNRYVVVRGNAAWIRVA